MSVTYEYEFSLLVKLGSIARHADELQDVLRAERAPVNAAVFDMASISGLLADPEVVVFMTAMDAAAMLPVKR